MKHLIALFTLILSFVTGMNAATSSGNLHDKALYVYLKSEGAKPFFYSTIDKIQMSKIDVNGKECDKFVTQEILTADSVYRYSMADIDSVAFHPLPTIYKPGVRIIDEELSRYVMRVDGDDIYFYSSLPSSLIPKRGDKLLHREINDKFPEGFRAEVLTIERRANEVYVHCEELSIFDVFDQLYSTEIVEMKAEEALTRAYDSSIIELPNMEIDFDDILGLGHPAISGSQEISLDSDLKNKIERSWGFDMGFSKLYFSMKPTLTLGYSIIISEDCALDFSLLCGLKLDCNLETLWSLNLSGGFEGIPQKFKKEKLFKDKIKFDVVVGSGIFGGGSLLLGHKSHTVIRTSQLYNLRYELLDLIDPLGPLKNANPIQKFRTSHENTTPLNYGFGSGYLGLGGALKFSCNLGLIPSKSNVKNWLGAELELFAGIDIASSTPLYMTQIPLEEKKFDPYNILSDAKPLKLEAGARIGFNFGFTQENIKNNGSLTVAKVPLWGYNTTLWERQFVPYFSSPEVKYNDDDHVYEVNYSISEKLLYGQHVGVVIYEKPRKQDENSEQPEPKVRWFDEKYRNPDNFSDYTIPLYGLEVNKEYEVYPCCDITTVTDPVHRNIILAPVQQKIYLKVKADIIGMSDFSKDGTSLQFYAAVDDPSMLKGKYFKVGVALSKTPEFESNRSIMIYPMEERAPNSYSTTVYNLENTTKYYYTAFLYCDNEYFFSDIGSFVTPDSEEVDLGLSVNWCSHNLGASEDIGFGNYYAWGETTHKGLYTWDTYFDSPIKYGEWIGCEYIEDITNTDKDPCPPGWHIPTTEEMNELINECTWEWTEKNGVNGFTITGPSGKWIFLPAAGLIDGGDVKNVGTYGGYWTGSINPTSTAMAKMLLINKESSIKMVQNSNRYFGRSVRAVKPKN